MSQVHVQGTISSSMHEALSQIARRRKTSIKAIVAEALEDYCRRETPLEDDPFAAMIGSVKGPEGAWSESKGWRSPE